VSADAEISLQCDAEFKVLAGDATDLPSEKINGGSGELGQNPCDD
jgi:hypothetical protein